MAFHVLDDPDARQLRRIPLGVRRKFAESGAHIEDAVWSRLPLLGRKRLAEMPVEDSVDRRAFAKLVEWLTKTFASSRREGFRPSLVGESFPWRDAEPPRELAEILYSGEWEALGPDGRFALVEGWQRNEFARVLQNYRSLTPAAHEA